MYDEVKQPINWKKVLSILGVVLVLIAVLVGAFALITRDKEEVRESVEYLNYGESDLNGLLEEVSWYDVATDFTVNVEAITDSYIYAKPSQYAEQLGELKTGDTFEVVAQCYTDNKFNDWFRVDYEGNTGYIYSYDIEYIHQEVNNEQ